MLGKVHSNRRNTAVGADPHLTFTHEHTAQGRNRSPQPTTRHLRAYASPNHQGGRAGTLRLAYGCHVNTQHMTREHSNFACMHGYTPNF